MSDVVVRNYTEDDLEGIINSYTLTPMKGPFFERNESFLRYFMRYPGVEDGIFIAQRNREIEGIAIVSISEKEDLREGEIIELWSRSASTVDLLVQKSLQYCSSKGVDRVQVKPPVLEGIDRIFDDWIKMCHPNVMAKPLSVLPIIKALLDTDFVKSHYMRKSFVFILDEEIIRVQVTADGVLTTELDRVQRNSDVLVEMSSKTFLEIVFGWTNPYMAYVARRIRVQGLQNAHMILKLLHSVRIGAAWNVAIVDDM